MGEMLLELFYHLQRVRQGGILSPMLLTLYVNQLTDKLIACNAGQAVILTVCA